MSAELELAQKKIADLEARIKAMQGVDEQLLLLPNGDLHKGIKMENPSKPNIDVEVLPESFGSPLNRQMAKVLEAAKGGHALTCLHCGIQYDGQGAEKLMRDHYTKDHPSVIAGYDQSELLMANLEEAKARLAEAEAKQG